MNLNMMNDSLKRHSQFLSMILFLFSIANPKPPFLDIEIDQGIYYYLRESTPASIIALTTLGMILISCASFQSHNASLVKNLFHKRIKQCFVTATVKKKN